MSTLDEAFREAAKVVEGVKCAICHTDIFPVGCLCRRQGEAQREISEVEAWFDTLDLSGMTPAQQRMMHNAARSATARALRHHGVHHLPTPEGDYATTVRLARDKAHGHDNAKWRPRAQGDYTAPQVW